MNTIGSVPFLISLSAVDNSRDDVPEPVAVLLPRTSYLLCVMQLVREAFGPFVPNFGKPLALWLKQGEQTIPWHYPAGALFDMLARRGGRGHESVSLPVLLTARMTPVATEVPNDIPLCTIGASSGCVDPIPGSTPPATPSNIEELKRERREMNHAISLLAKQNLKAGLAACFGTARHFFTLDPESTLALADAGIAVSEDALDASGLLQRHVKAYELLRKQYIGVDDSRHLIALFDGRADVLTPHLVSVAAAAVADTTTLGDFLALVVEASGGVAKVLGPVPHADGGNTTSTTTTTTQLLVDAVKQHAVVFLIGGVVLPWDVPAAYVLKTFVGFDLRLSVVIVAR